MLPLHGRSNKIIYYRSQDEMMAYRALISVCLDCTVKGADYCPVFGINYIFGEISFAVSQNAPCEV